MAETVQTTKTKTETKKETPTPKIKDPSKQPILKVNMRGLISASCFENQNQNDKGETFLTRNVVLQRRYQDKADGQWKSTNVIRENDLPKAILALQMMFKKLAVYDETPSTTSTEEAGETVE